MGQWRNGGYGEIARGNGGKGKVNGEWMRER
jgi:hypothetical protein